jgi:hypothetical protein
MAAYRESVSALNALLAREPDNLLWQRDLHRIAGKLGDTLSTLGRHEQAACPPV